MLTSGYEMELQFHLVPTSKQTAVSVWHIPVAICTVLNSWWRTERPPKTCRVSFQNKINLIHWCIWLVLLQKYILTHDPKNAIFVLFTINFLFIFYFFVIFGHGWCTKLIILNVVYHRHCLRRSYLSVRWIIVPEFTVHLQTVQRAVPLIAWCAVS